MTRHYNILEQITYWVLLFDKYIKQRCLWQYKNQKNIKKTDDYKNKVKSGQQAWRDSLSPSVKPYDL